MTQVTFRLMQESGVQGPSKTITLENPDPHPAPLRKMARSWAGGQTGHPWDTLTLEIARPGLPLETVEVAQVVVC